MSDTVSVAVGGTIDRKAERCPSCNAAMLFRVGPPSSDTVVGVFCQTLGCPEWLKERAR